MTSDEFVRLVSPVIGRSAAADLAELYPPPKNTAKLAPIAAFFLKEYDDAAMPLDPEDWKNMRTVLEDESEKMDLDTLTDLMGELLGRGLLS
jgi:hypothetical protein